MIRALAATLVLVLAGSSAASSATEELPLKGTTARGQEWRLRAAEPFPDDDVPSSWCLDLAYTNGAVVDGDRYGGGLRTCGRRPARRISGMIVVDCQGATFVFGAVRSGVRHVRIRRGRHPTQTPRFANPPPRSGFSGRTFIAVLHNRRSARRLTARGAGRNPIVRIPARSDVCRRIPGAPKRDQGFLEFETPK